MCVSCGTGSGTRNALPRSSAANHYGIHSFGGRGIRIVAASAVNNTTILQKRPATQQEQHKTKHGIQKDSHESTVSELAHAVAPVSWGNVFQELY